MTDMMNEKDFYHHTPTHKGEPQDEASMPEVEGKRKAI